MGNGRVRCTLTRRDIVSRVICEYCGQGGAGDRRNRYYCCHRCGQKHSMVRQDFVSRDYWKSLEHRGAILKGLVKGEGVIR